MRKSKRSQVPSTLQLPDAGADRYWRVADSGMDHWGHFNTDHNDYVISLWQRRPGRWRRDRGIDSQYVEPDVDMAQVLQRLETAAQEMLARAAAAEARRKNMRALVGA